MIKKEDFEMRLVELEDSRKKLIDSLNILDEKRKQIAASIVAHNGAIEDCNRWINKCSDDGDGGLVLDNVPVVGD